jgi:hypothetical protein
MGSVVGMITGGLFAKLSEIVYECEYEKRVLLFRQTPIWPLTSL